MKKFIYITVAFVLLLVLIGCATMTPEERKAKYDLRKEVGNSQFVGSHNNYDAMSVTGKW